MADPCVWEVIVEDDTEFEVYDADSPEPQHSPTGRWLQYVCPGLGAVAVDGQFLIPEGGPVVDPAVLAADALAKIDVGAPTISTSPSASGRLVVQVPTWLWVDQGWWTTYEATASAGRVSSTVTATPVATEWNLGDGHRVSCRGPGVAWRPGRTDSPGACTHTYRRTSAGQPGGTFTIEATVTFDVSWSSTVAAGGALPAISRSSTVDVEVGEVQAIGTRGGR